MNTKLLHEAEVKFKAVGIDTARLDAKVLWEYNPKTFEQSVARRVKHEPVAYITGVKEFWSIPIKVTPAVIVPRPETEHIVERVLELLSPSPHPSPLEGEGARRAGEGVTILDLCTGSGCIVAALATELPNAHFVATDISAEALSVAKENLEFAKERVKLLQGNLFSALPPPAPPYKGGGKTYDIITANPPYVPDDEWSTLATDITNYEPKHALVAGPTGLDFITEILEDAPRFLKPGGHLVMEIGDGQANDTVAIAKRIGTYKEMRLKKDLSGIERVLSLRHG